MKEVLEEMPIMQALDWQQVFYVNPSIGEDAIGAMLLQRGKGSLYMHPFYYGLIKNKVGNDECDVCLSMLLPLSSATMAICILE